MLLITSAEHYGAVLNSEFDYDTYLDTLAAEGLNYTRIFTGSYFEKAGSFGIQKNTLAPTPGKALTPWERSKVSGNKGGGNRFDLDNWNPQYFSRLKDFVGGAGRRGIIVEVTLFSSIYTDVNWEINPLNRINNVNETDPIERSSVHTLANGNLLEYQKKMVRKIVQELGPFDNIFFEIQNEPYADQTDRRRVLNPLQIGSQDQWTTRVDLALPSSLEWQLAIAETIEDEEAELGVKHLIAQNYCNFHYPLSSITPAIRILYFHSAWPQAALGNYGWDRVIGFDESGFSGSADETYRRQAWHFILSGGGLFNNLDYSFAVGHEKGTAENDAPGGGSAKLRKQLRVLKDFMYSFDFVRLLPSNDLLVLTPGAFSRLLASAGEAYAGYFEGEVSEVTLRLDPGNYVAEWLNPPDGKLVKSQSISHKGGNRVLRLDSQVPEVALRLLRKTD
jgi:hypothetical protein